MLLPSIGLAELIILAGVAGLAMLFVATIAVAVVRRRKTNDTLSILQYSQALAVIIGSECSPTAFDQEPLLS